MQQDLLFEAPQLRGRVEAELLADTGAVPFARAQRLGLATCPVEGTHQLGHRTLPQRALVDQHRELADELGPLPASEVGLDSRLDRFEAQLLEAQGLGPRELFVGEVLQRRSSPEREGPPQGLRCGRGIRRQELPGLGERRLERMGVERGRVGADRVAVISSDEHAALPPLGPTGFEGGAQTGDVHPQRLLLARRIVSPQLLEDALGGNDSVEVEQQQGEQRALLRRPQINGLAVRSDLERPQDPELHHALTSELTPTYSELNDLKPHVKWGGPRPFRCSRSPPGMTNTTTAKSIRPTVGIVAAVAAVASVLCAGAINVSAESAPRPAPKTLNARQIAELQAIADWAREQGLTGLSPASLGPVDKP